MYGIFLILLFYLLGCFVAALIGNFVPGSVIGMILLFCALSLKKLESKKRSKKEDDDKGDR